MFSILGYLSVALLLILVAPYILRIANKKFFKNNEKIKKIIKELKKIHKPAGILVAILSIIHAYMIFGLKFNLHTGTLVYLSMFITIIFGVLFGYKKKKLFLDMHKTFVLLTVALLAIHLFFPSALYYLIN